MEVDAVQYRLFLKRRAEMVMCHTWPRVRQIWEIHATSLPGLVERLHEFPKSDGFLTMYGCVSPLLHEI